MNVSGEEMVVLISTTALPSWSATLITADSSVRLLLIGARGATTFPVGVTLIQRGASRMVAAEPASAPTSAARTTMAMTPSRRRGLTGCSAGTGDNGAGSGGGEGRNLGSLAIELNPILPL